jgi:hypothetical protein
MKEKPKHSRRKERDSGGAPEITQGRVDSANLYQGKKPTDIRERLARRATVTTRISAAEALRRERNKR